MALFCGHCVNSLCNKDIILLLANLFPSNTDVQALMAWMNLSRKSIASVAMSANVVDLPTRITTTRHSSIGKVSVLPVHPLKLYLIPRIDQNFVILVLVLATPEGYVDATMARMHLADDQGTSVVGTPNKQRFSTVCVPAAIHCVLWNLAITRSTPYQLVCHRPWNKNVRPFRHSTINGATLTVLPVRYHMHIQALPAAPLGVRCLLRMRIPAPVSQLY